MRAHTSIVFTLLASGTAIAGDPAIPTFPAAAPSPTVQPEPQPKSGLAGVEALIKQAERLKKTLHSELARSMLNPVPGLPRIEPRTLYVNDKTGNWYTPQERDLLPPAEQTALTEVVRDEQFYYSTRFRTPLTYTRPLDLLAAHDAAHDFDSLAGVRLLDYGYGAIGQLRLMATSGAHCIGIDNDPSLAKLYSQPDDVGEVLPFIPRFAHRIPMEERPNLPGSIDLRCGRFPVDAGCTPADILKVFPKGLHLFISKDTLTNGCVHPAQPVDKQLLVDLGTTEAAFLTAVHDVLANNGYFLIYNLSPAPSKPGEPYNLLADGHCPFTKQQLEAAGFEVIVYDETDDKAAREMAHALGWDKDGMDVDNDLFAHWTLARRADASKDKPQ